MKINRKRKLKIVLTTILLSILLNSCFPYYRGHSRYMSCYPRVQYHHYYHR